MAGGLQIAGMDAGDVATWVSAIGTFAAVLVALVLARNDGKRREQDRTARGTVIASFLFADVGVVHRAMELALEKLEKVDSAASRETMAECIFQAYQIMERADTAKIAAHMDKLVDLPARHAVTLAALPDNVKAVRNVLIHQVNAGSSASVSDLRDAASDLRVQLAITKKRLDLFTAEFGRNFTT